jgi:hypothetical protein
MLQPEIGPQSLGRQAIVAGSAAEIFVKHPIGIAILPPYPTYYGFSICRKKLSAASPEREMT